MHYTTQLVYTLHSTAKVYWYNVNLVHTSHVYCYTNTLPIYIGILHTWYTLHSTTKVYWYNVHLVNTTHVYCYTATLAKVYWYISHLAHTTEHNPGIFG